MPDEPVDHEVERIARLMHAAFNEFNERRPRKMAVGLGPWETLQALTKDCYRHVARKVVDDPGKRM